MLLVSSILHMFRSWIESLQLNAVCMCINLPIVFHEIYPYSKNFDWISAKVIIVAQLFVVGARIHLLRAKRKSFGIIYLTMEFMALLCFSCYSLFCFTTIQRITSKLQTRKHFIIYTIAKIVVFSRQ